MHCFIAVAWQESCVTFGHRQLFALGPWEDRLLVHGHSETLPHPSPPKRLVLHLPQPHLLLPGPISGTLLWWVQAHQRAQMHYYYSTVLTLVCKDSELYGTTVMCCLGRECSKHLETCLSTESADGLCCLLREPCIIQGSNNTTMTRPYPKAIRRPTLNWKDVDRWGTFLNPPSTIFCVPSDLHTTYLTICQCDMMCHAIAMQLTAL